MPAVYDSRRSIGCSRAHMAPPSSVWQIQNEQQNNIATKFESMSVWVLEIRSVFFHALRVFIPTPEIFWRLFLLSRAHRTLAHKLFSRFSTDFNRHQKFGRECFALFWHALFTGYYIFLSFFCLLPSDLCSTGFHKTVYLFFLVLFLSFGFWVITWHWIIYLVDCLAAESDVFFNSFLLAEMRKINFN